MWMMRHDGDGDNGHGYGRVKHGGNVVHDHEDEGGWHMMDEEVEDGWESYGVLRWEKKTKTTNPSIPI